MKTNNTFLNIGGGFIGLSFYFFYKVMDRILNYANPDDEYNYINAHVGGDAYNYIINGTHATMFAVIAIGFLLIGILFVLFHHHHRLQGRLVKEEPVKQVRQRSQKPREQMTESERFVEEYLDREDNQKE